jgi:hypothetical protein
MKTLRYLLIVVLCLSLTGIALAQSGTYTSHGYFYLPPLGAKGTVEWQTYNAGMQTADTAIASKTSTVALGYTIGDAGCTTLAAALTTIGSTPATLHFPVAIYNIAANTIIPANITLAPENGAILSVPTGITLTINGPVQAGPYQIFSWTGTGVVVFGEGSVNEVNVNWWGASTAASASVNTAAIQAAVNSFGVIAFPEGVFNVASQITIAHAGCFLRGAPANLSMKPTARTTINYTSASGILFQFSTPGAMLSYVGMDGFNLASSSGNSTALQLCDVSRPQFKNISIYPWYGTGIDFRGRELGYFENLDIQCNVPIIINKNSNASAFGYWTPATSIDIDFTTFRNVNLVCNSTASTGASLTIADGVNLTNVHFDTIDFELGANGVYWNDTTSTITSANLTFDNCRMEQATPTTGWCFWINRAYMIDNIDIHQFTNSSADGGFAYIRNCRDFKVSNSTYYGTAAVPINGLGCYSVTLENFLIREAAANSFPDMACALFIQGTPSEPINYASYVAAASIDNQHVKIFGTNVWTYKGNLNNFTSLNIPGCFGTQARILVSCSKGTGTVEAGDWISTSGDADGTSTLIVGTTNTSSRATAGKLSVYRESGNSSIQVVNNLGETREVFVIVYWN